MMSSNSEIPVPGGGTASSVAQTSLSSLLLFGLIFSFAGVAIAESISRVKKKRML